MYFINICLLLILIILYKIKYNKNVMLKIMKLIILYKYDNYLKKTHILLFTIVPILK